jgi:hypothetical protein
LGNRATRVHVPSVGLHIVGNAYKVIVK